MRRLACLAVLTLSGCVVHAHAPPRPVDPPVSRDEAARLLSAGVSEAVVWEQVDLRGMEPLDAEAVATLKKAGAPDPLLQKMILAERKPPPPVPVVVPYYYGYSPVYASFGFGFGYSHWRHSHYSHRHYHGSRGIRVYR